LRILLSIGPTETMHFQTWQDKAGNANTNPNGPPANPPFSVHDPVNDSDVTFFDLHFSQPETRRKMKGGSLDIPNEAVLAGGRTQLERVRCCHCLLFFFGFRIRI